MGYIIPQACFQDPGSFPLGDIFSTVNTDDDDVVTIIFFDLPQLRENVDAVDSAVRPEVEQYDFPAELLQAQRVATGMDPIEA
jgi:hypothetical protein